MSAQAKSSRATHKPKDSEVWARATLDCLPEIVSTVWHDVGGGGYDLDALLADGSGSAVEITESTRRDFRASHARREKAVPNSTLSVPGLSRLWTLTPSEHARFREWDIGLLSVLLSQLEASDATTFSVEVECEDAADQRVVDRLQHEFGIVWSWSQPGAGTGVVWVDLANPAEWWTGGNAGQYALTTLECEAAKVDNVGKLVNSGRADNRLFVWVDGLDFPAHEDLWRAEAPNEVPVLDVVLSGAWLAARRNGTIRGLAFDARAGWRSFEVLEDDFRHAEARILDEFSPPSGSPEE